MVRVIRSAVLKYKDVPQALHTAKAVAAYFKEAYGHDIHVFSESAGMIHWIVDYPDYAALGNTRARMVSDKHYWEITSKMAEYVIEGSLQDKVLNEV